MAEYTPVMQTSNQDATASEKRVDDEGSKDTVREHDHAILTPSLQNGSQPPKSIHQHVHNPILRILASGFRLWAAEIVACALLLISIIAIIVTLYPHQGRPLPEWPFSISLNTLLAIYTFVLQGSLAVVLGSCVSQLQWAWFSKERPLSDVSAYAGAASGPLGSANLLWKQRLREPITAIGALITISAVAIDPFVQQLVSYSDCTATVADNAAMPRTNFFRSQGNHIGAARINIVPPIQTAINAGIYSDINSISVDCPTGNCTFSREYATVAYCSSCHDISSTMAFNTSCFVEENNQTSCTQFTDDIDTSSPNITSYLPDGTSMNWAGNAHSTSPFMVCNVDSEYENVTFLQGQNVFTHFHVDPTSGNNIDDCGGADNNTWYCRGWGAARCTIQPCIRAYESTVKAGQLNETITDLYTGEWGFNSYEYMGGVLDTNCITNGERAQLVQQGYNLSTGDRWIPFNTSVNTTNIADMMPSEVSFPESMWARQCIYLLDWQFSYSLWDYYLEAFFSGNVSGLFSNYDTVTEYTGPQVLQTMFNYSRMSLEGTQSLWDGMANSLTTFIRQNGESVASIPTTGEVLHYATCLNVHWPWIALPATLIVLAWALLVLTIYTAVLNQSPMWKDYPLSLAFHGPWSGNVARPNGDLNIGTTEGMKAVADGVLVRLENDDGVYHLRPTRDALLPS